MTISQAVEAAAAKRIDGRVFLRELDGSPSDKLISRKPYQRSGKWFVTVNRFRYEIRGYQPRDDMFGYTFCIGNRYEWNAETYDLAISRYTTEQ